MSQRSDKRSCGSCGVSLEGLHKNRKFCSISCKEKNRAVSTTRLKWKKEYSETQSNKDSHKKYYLKNTVKAHKATAEWKKKNQQAAKLHARKTYLNKYYGLSLEQYDAMLEKQNFCCAICNGHKDTFAKNLAVDHDHHTGEVRALLCYSCNRNVIGRHRDPALLYKAAQYLEGPFTGLFVPERYQKSRRRKRK